MKKLSIKESVQINEAKSRYDRIEELGVGFTAPTSGLDDKNFVAQITNFCDAIKNKDLSEKERAFALKSLKRVKKDYIDRDIANFEEFDAYWREHYKYAKGVFKNVLKMLPAELNED